ncbi:tetratricopeptide repeat protein [Paenibacillus sp. HJL G12]|uniref:Tetratricopeptide repeat protein n=1 Tax=Paenibacillus dendrobii TaxID=2691084 RepID=A0A7X3IMP9_9BACL|nr:SMI1/KNR4 family protein [Paenibacillus dendrobii]MWV46286.1 tetratricopeptide repeat protein [Paenibacillus dendrobii]
MREDLLAQLDTWHEEDEYGKTVDAIMEIPAEERDYVLVSHLGRALNNLEQYEEAVEQFLTIAEEGKEDPLWHYRIGLAYYYLDRYEEALRAFEAAHELDPGDEDTQEFLEDIRSKLSDETDEEHEEDHDEETADDPSGDSSLETDAVIPAESPVIAADLDTPVEGSGFWNDNAQALERYVSAPPTDEMISSVEEKLVFKLPASYIELMKVHNGGIPHNRCFPIAKAADEGATFITISGILGIGFEKKHSLCGELGSQSVIENGGYPEIGVMICDCPSESGIVMLDYRESLNDGEPEVVYVDKGNKKIAKLAPNFEAFMSGLVNERQLRAEELT